MKISISVLYNIFFVKSVLNVVRLLSVCTSGVAEINDAADADEDTERFQGRPATDIITNSTESRKSCNLLCRILLPFHKRIRLPCPLPTSMLHCHSVP